METLWGLYIDHLGSKPTAKTMGYTGKAVLDYFGKLTPDQITIDDSRNYLKNRLLSGKKIGTVWTELGHLRSTFTWAMKNNLITKRPYIELPPKPDSKVEPLSDIQIQKLIAACITPHLRVAVILLLTTGARVSAILDRRWENIHFDTGIIDLRLPDGVTRKGRAVVPMNQLARTTLEGAYRGRLTEWVVEYNGNPVKSIRTGYKAALKRAGLKDIHIHQIRHTVAVRMLQAGTPIEKVSQYLGHSNTKITFQTYARFIPSHMADAASILEFKL